MLVKKIRMVTVSKRKSKALEDECITIEIEIASKRCLGASKREKWQGNWYRNIDANLDNSELC
jgi:hypothetical protein